MSAPLDDYDGLEDSRRGYDLWCDLKRAELRGQDSRAGQYPMTRSENPVMPSALMLREARTPAGNSSEAKTGQSVPAERTMVADPTPRYRKNTDCDAVGAGGSPAIHAARATLIAAMLRHYVPGKIAEHPEINEAFHDWLYANGPVRIGEVRR